MRDDALRFCRHPFGQHFGTDETEMRERFVASEEVEHVDALRLTRMRRFDGGEKDIDGEVDADRLELLAGRRTEADLVWDLF